MMTNQPDSEPRHLLRQESLRRRNALPLAERRHKSAAIARAVTALPAVARAHTIFTYVNFQSEVETRGLIDLWLAADKIVSVPLTIVAASRLDPYRITVPERDLHPGYCRIPEPDPGRATLVAPESIEVIILPGSVFDAHGGRLGYGGGFYDRFIAHQAPQAYRIGLAFELQLTNDLPLLAHDQRLHALVTEERVLSFA
jgi:5-formyltetrahydrofolate cyclo-ligase